MPELAGQAVDRRSMTKTVSGRPAPRYGALGVLLVTTARPSSTAFRIRFMPRMWPTVL